MHVWCPDSQKKVLDTLELKSQVVMSCCVGARTELRFPAKEQIPLTSE